MWQTLVSKLFGALKFEGAKALLHQLEHFAAPYIVKTMSAEVGPFLVEGVNQVIAVAVNALDKDKAGVMAKGYVAEIEKSLAELTTALTQYVPLQVEYEVALKQFGTGSKEVVAAAAARDAGAAAIKTDVADLFGQVAHVVN